MPRQQQPMRTSIPVPQNRLVRPAGPSLKMKGAANPPARQMKARMGAFVKKAGAGLQELQNKYPSQRRLTALKGAAKRGVPQARKALGKVSRPMIRATKRLGM